MRHTAFLRARTAPSPTTARDDRSDGYSRVIARSGGVRVVVDVFNSGWLVQKQRRNVRWLTMCEAQTRIQILVLWFALTDDDGAEIFKLPERFPAGGMP